MNPEDAVFALLAADNIPYTHHLAAFTYEEMVQLGVTIEGEVYKNLFFT